MLHRWTRALATLLAIAIAAVVLPVVGADAQSAEQAKLKAARDRLAAVSRDLDAATSTARTADQELADADARLAEVEAVVNEIAAMLDRQRQAVAEATERLAEVEADAVAIRERLTARATSMFKQGAVRDFDVLLSSSGAEEALARSTYLRALTLGDRSVSEALAAAEIAVTAERERLAIEEQRLDEMLVEEQEVLAEVERLRNSRALAAANARAEVERLASEQDDLEAESKQLERLIRQQQERARREAEAARRAAAAAQRAQARVSAPSSSGFAWPLCAPVTSEYGPRWGRMHHGIDQGAPTGTAIGASKAGTVIFAGWQGGYGNLTLIDHHDGVVTAYAHQSRFAVTSGSVSQGQTIGYIGSTGNSTGPHLHFETRVNGSPVNPRQYLPGGPC